MKLAAFRGALAIGIAAGSLHLNAASSVELIGHELIATRGVKIATLSSPPGFEGSAASSTFSSPDVCQMDAGHFHRADADQAMLASPRQDVGFGREPRSSAYLRHRAFAPSSVATIFPAPAALYECLLITMIALPCRIGSASLCDDFQRSRCFSSQRC